MRHFFTIPQLQKLIITPTTVLLMSQRPQIDRRPLTYKIYQGTLEQTTYSTLNVAFGAVSYVY